MMYVRFENFRNTELGPLLEINLYSEEENGVMIKEEGYCCAVMISSYKQFICYRTYNGTCTQSSIGISSVIDMSKLIRSSYISVADKKKIIYSQTIAAITDFLSVISDLFKVEISFPKR